jgi:hypothetical protein
MKLTPIVLGIAMLVGAAVGAETDDYDLHHHKVIPEDLFPCSEGRKACNEPGGIYLMDCIKGKWVWDRPCRSKEHCFEIGKKAGCIESRVIPEEPCSEYQLVCNEPGGSWIMRCILGKWTWEKGCRWDQRCFEFGSKAGGIESRRVECL